MLAGVAVVAAAGLAVFASVELPSVETILTDLGSRLGNWTYLLVGVLAFLETSAFVGLIAPGEVAVVFGGFVAGQGAINAVVLWLIVWFCAAAGDSTGYVLGRKLGRSWALRYGERVGVTAGRFDAVERFFLRHGGKTILIGRFIGFFRSLGPFVAGSARVPYGRFLAALGHRRRALERRVRRPRLRLLQELPPRVALRAAGEHRVRCPRRPRRRRLRPLPALA